VDLSTTKVKTIPESCFKNCDSLTGKVILPTTASSIKSAAFDNDKKVTVTIPSTEVFIATDAFEHGPNAKKDAGDGQVTFRTYPDSAASEYATYYDIECDTTLGKIWNVSFMDYDGTQIGSTLQVENGTVLSSTQKPADPTRAGYTFSKWISTTGAAIDDKITADTTFIASYTAESGSHDGSYYVYFYDGVDGSLISKVTVASGAAATAPTAPAHSGYTFTKWSSDFSKVTADTSAIALYASSGSSSTSTSGAAASTSTSKTSTSSTSGSTSYKHQYKYEHQHIDIDERCIICCNGCKRQRKRNISGRNYSSCCSCCSTVRQGIQQVDGRAGHSGTGKCGDIRNDIHNACFSGDSHSQLCRVSIGGFFVGIDREDFRKFNISVIEQCGRCFKYERRK
jgi:hypothetical protein